MVFEGVVGALFIGGDGGLAVCFDDYLFDAAGLVALARPVRIFGRALAAMLINVCVCCEEEIVIILELSCKFLAEDVEWMSRTSEMLLHQRYLSFK